MSAADFKAPLAIAAPITDTPPPAPVPLLPPAITAAAVDPAAAPRAKGAMRALIAARIPVIRVAIQDLLCGVISKFHLAVKWLRQHTSGRSCSVNLLANSVDLEEKWDRAESIASKILPIQSWKFRIEYRTK